MNLFSYSNHQTHFKLLCAEYTPYKSSSRSYKIHAKQSIKCLLPSQTQSFTQFLIFIHHLSYVQPFVLNLINMTPKFYINDSYLKGFNYGSKQGLCKTRFWKEEREFWEGHSMCYYGLKGNQGLRLCKGISTNWLSTNQNTQTSIYLSKFGCRYLDVHSSGTYSWQPYPNYHKEKKENKKNTLLFQMLSLLYVPLTKRPGWQAQEECPKAEYERLHITHVLGASFRSTS